MTSSRSFFRVMREDMRHKTWMVALSVLGNFIALPVMWLLLTESYDGLSRTTSREELFTRVFYGVMTPAFINVFAFCGVVCVVMAFVTGVFGFRYVFRTDMVDTYHSLPIKRKTLYGAGYLNGILIWFLPFLAFLVPTFAMMCSYASRFEQMLDTLGLKGGVGVSGYPYIEEPLWTVLAKEMLLNVVVLAAAYLLVYHVVLTAVMLSGNILNTLVSMVIIGFGVVGIYSLGASFISIYLDTFYPYHADHWARTVYASPICSAIRLLYVRLEEGSVSELWFSISVNIGVTVLLGICAYHLYKKRASEMAEQGITNKVVATLMRLVASVCAGMFGWLLMAMIVNESQHVLWGSFGAVLAAGLTAGILNIIFQMDFGAFFAHKWQMAVGIVLSLLLCGSFYGDWFGYDTYLPQKEQIAYISVSDWDLSSKAFYQNVNFLLDNMCYQDRNVIYEWLERMTDGRDKTGTGDYVDVKITQEHGGSYYRRYWMTQADKDLLWPILASEEYLKYAYLIDEELVDEDTVRINVMGTRSYLETVAEREAFHGILQAYNQDVLEYPESVLLREGRVLAIISFDIRSADKESGAISTGHAELVICEGMEYSLAALREAGYEEALNDKDAAEIIAVVLDPEIVVVPEEAIAMARAYYGVDEVKMAEEQRMIGEQQEAQEELEVEDRKLIDSEAAEHRDAAEYIATVRVSEPQEIEELLGLLSPLYPTHTSKVFQKSYKAVTVIDSKGNSERWYLQEGMLPEKYILRFGEQSDL